MRNTPAQAVKTIADAAGWRFAAPNASGGWHYAFEKGLSLNLESPDGRSLVLWSELERLPTDSDSAKTERLHLIGRLAAGVLSRRPSTISLENNRLVLYRRVLLDASDEKLVEETRAFLNDEAWWRSRLTAECVPTNPFQLSGFFPSSLTY